MELGLLLACAGAAFATGLAAGGSAIGVGSASEAATAVILDDPKKFGRLLVLQLLPGTQGLYGFIISIMILTNVGILGGTIPDFAAGSVYFAAGISIAFGGYLSAVAQGKVCAAAVNIIVKKPSETGKAIVAASLPEFYALISFIVSLLLILNADQIAGLLLL